MATPPTHGLDGSGARPERTQQEKARIVAISILTVVAVVFALFNLDEVKVHLIFGTVTMPLFIVIVACLLIGGAIGWFLSRRGARRGRRA